MSTTQSINTNLHLYPFCIVWTILPCISWFIPVIGHTGICDDQGIIYDFLGYHINKRYMAFGDPKKYVQLQIKQHQVESYLKSLKHTNQQYSNRMHNICCNNCHHHVADVLNEFGYRGKRNWGQVSIWWMCLTQSKYVSWWSVVAVYLPFLLICTAIILICTLTKKQ